MKLALVLRELVPVAVGAFDDDLALLEQALEKNPDLEFLVFGFGDTNGDVLEVDEQRDFSFSVHIPWLRQRGSGIFFWRLFSDAAFSRHGSIFCSVT
jgi:hypothetical protein